MSRRGEKKLDRPRDENGGMYRSLGVGGAGGGGGDPGSEVRKGRELARDGCPSRRGGAIEVALFRSIVFGMVT